MGSMQNHPWHRGCSQMGLPEPLSDPALRSTIRKRIVRRRQKVDSGAWSLMSPGLGGNVTTSRNGAALVNAAVAHVRAGGGFTCAQMVGGTIRCWGDNGSGQLGNGTNTSSTFPVAVTGIATSS